jgi:hypothetical protein
MARPTIEVLGVYALPVATKLVREQTDILYGTTLSREARHDAERQCREQLESTVLVETLVRDPDNRFKTDNFCQAQDGVPKSHWQVAWAEAYLSEDGESLLGERRTEQPKAKTFRVAFFIHCWNPSKPLVTSYGDVKCPAVDKMPKRLQTLAPYVLVE